MSPPRTPTFPQVLNAAIRGALQEVHTSMPGRIESFDETKQVADVQPTVDQLVVLEDGSVVTSRYAVLRNVPVVFPGGGGFRLTFPVKQGDYCLILFQESSIDRWRSNGGLVDPQDQRRFHVSDAICMVGLNPNSTPWSGVGTTGATFGKDGGPQFVARDSTLEIGGDDANPPSDWAALASLVKTELQRRKDWEDSMKSTYDNHTHELSAVVVTGLKGVGTGTVVVTGTIGVGPTGVPSGSVSSQANAPASVQDVKSTVVKVK